jgi:hypothetical protein
MFTFKISEHQFKPGTRVVEICYGEKLLGVIYPTERGIKVVSKYFLNPERMVKIERGENKFPHLPAILINFF